MAVKNLYTRDNMTRAVVEFSVIRGYKLQLGDFANQQFYFLDKAGHEVKVGYRQILKETQEGIQ